MRRHPRISLVGLVAAGVLATSLARAAAPAGQYTVTAETVLDNKTGLTWQRVVPAETYTWFGALAYCEGLTLDGKSDWRLPNIKELQTIVDESASNPAIDTAAFPNTPTDFFWSSTPQAGGTVAGFYLGVPFDIGGTGTTNPGPSNAKWRVRCVRSAAL